MFVGMSSAALANAALAVSQAPVVQSLADGDVNAPLDGVKTVVQYLFTEFGNLVTTIAAQPLLLIPVGIFIAGAIIGLAKRLIQG